MTIEAQPHRDVFRTLERVMELATRQHGNVTRHQLVRLGLSVQQIKTLIVRSYLIPRHRGVYAVGHLALPPFAVESAALLAIGVAAQLRARSAAYALGIALDRRGPRSPHGEVELTVVGRRPRPRGGIDLVAVASLHPDDVVTRHGLRTASAARVFVELAGVLPAGRLAWPLDTAAAEGRVTRRAILAALARAPANMAGAASLRRLLDDERPSTPTRSRIEHAVLQLCRRAGLPAPQVNAKLGPYEVDFLWPAQKVVLEVDSYAFHSTRERLRRDRRKDTHLRNNRFAVIRAADEQLLEIPEGVLVELARAIG